MSAPVDVLAVWDALIRDARARGFQESGDMFHPGIRQFSDARDATAKMLDESDAFRAAVAELIEACDMLERSPNDTEVQGAFSGALARVKGGAA